MGYEIGCAKCASVSAGVASVVSECVFCCIVLAYSIVAAALAQ